MDSVKLDSGDNNNVISSTDQNEIQSKSISNESAEKSTDAETYGEQFQLDGNLSKTIDKNETKLKERIAQCKDILTSLKQELNEEKIKLAKEVKDDRTVKLQSSDPISKLSFDKNCNEYTLHQVDDLIRTTKMYTSTIDGKLYCDENLLEYEKQLQKYQKTLNMAQVEKKNAIRKQMLLKAFKLKLLEVENQCNIELIRVKQSLQCLEPLKLIADKWKFNKDDDNYNNYELLPRYPELGTTSGSDISTTSNGEDNDIKLSN